MGDGKDALQVPLIDKSSSIELVFHYKKEGKNKSASKYKVWPLRWRNKELDKVTKSLTKSLLIHLLNGLADLLGLELLEL